MRKLSLIEFLKKHRVFYTCYYCIMTFGVNFMKIFVKPDDKLILFVVYGGAKYADSPRCLYEAMLKDDRFKEYKLVWAFREPNQFPMVSERIKIDTFKYFITALKAQCWITNESVTRALKFKGKRTFYFSTTHTALPKHGGINKKNESTFTALGYTKYDCTCAQSDFEKEIQIQKYGLKDNQVVVCGYPKNDIIANSSIQDVISIRKKLNIQDNRKLLLYAPTFREGHKKQAINLSRWVDILGDEYWILFRAHHSMVSNVKIEDYSNAVIDVSDYPDNTELLIVSDVLVSDYSGIFFEFGVQEKPMYCFAFDKNEYTQKRGLYINTWDELPGGNLDEIGLLELIKNGDKEEIMKIVNVFREKYITEFGKATQCCVDIIYDNIH